MEMIDGFVQAINDFQSEFNDTLHAGQRLCFLTRGKELQIAARDAFALMKAKAKQLKAQAIANEYEDAANALLSFEETAEAFINELNMWVALKEEKYAEAWDFLVEAQMAATNAMQAHHIADHLEGYIARLSAVEEIIFPNHGFLSIGGIVRKAECGICGQEYGTCDHLVGKPYMGELCYRRITEYELEEASLVTNPANKHCRVLRFTDTSGRMVDAFTLRVVPEKPSTEDSVPSEGDS